MITLKKILISHCTSGVYLRWWFNGWHYWLFSNGYDISQKTEHQDTMISKFFSVISKIEKPTKIKSEYSYNIVLQGISSGNINGFQGLLLAEKVEQYEEGVWREVKITRKEHVVKENSAPAYTMSFEVTRKELIDGSSVFQKTQHVYVNDVECDLDDDEIIAINKQVNDIAEMQDRQSDYSAEFKIRKTRTMRDLFELTGEIGANTEIPYTKLPCRYVNNGIEVVSSGYLIVNKSDYNYYYVSIYSGNLNFFNKLEDLTLNNLTLPSCNHTWNAITQSSTNKSGLNYVYPLIEPSDDGGMNPLTDNGSRTELYGGWIWPFVKCKAIFDEIISNAGFTSEGDILTDPTFLKMFMPISDLSIPSEFLSKYLYSVQNTAQRTYYSSGYHALLGGTLISGEGLWGNYLAQFGILQATYSGKYKFALSVKTYLLSPSPIAYIYENTVYTAMELMTYQDIPAGSRTMRIYNYELEYDITAGDNLLFYINSSANPFYLFLHSVAIKEITDAKVNYGSIFDSTTGLSIANNLPDISQTDFIKMICNFFGLIPDVNERTRKIKFWNYSSLYDNIPIARDWSAYLSEIDDEVEFKFGEYCRNNFMRFNDSDDVIEDTGLGNMTVDDETLEEKQDVIEVPVSTSDQVKILTDVNVSRIAMNTYNKDDNAYEQEDSIDPHVVIIEQVSEQLTSPVYQKTFGIRDTLSGGTSYDITSPYKARAMTFRDTIMSYSSLSRMLTKTNLRRVKLNLPVYEVSGIKHYIPIYFSQFRAYFYVNKIENYVSGQLCTVELIKL